MGKVLAKKAGVAAIETTLRAAMPELARTLEAIQADLRQFRASVDERFAKFDERFERIEQRLLQLERGEERLRLEFREGLNDQFERLLTVLNELGQRITRVDQKLEDYTEFTRMTSSKLDGWLERLVVVERGQGTKRRRAS